MYQIEMQIQIDSSASVFNGVFSRFDLSPCVRQWASSITTRIDYRSGGKWDVSRHGRRDFDHLVIHPRFICLDLGSKQN